MIKLIIPIMMLLLGTLLFGQTRVLIDNRTDHEVNTDLIHRLTTEALVDAPVRKATILVHIWPRKALRSMTEQNMDTFFASPNHVFMHEVDYLARMGHQSGNRLVFGYEKRIAASSESWSR